MQTTSSGRDLPKLRTDFISSCSHSSSTYHGRGYAICLKFSLFILGRRFSIPFKNIMSPQGIPFIIMNKWDWWGEPCFPLSIMIKWQFISVALLWCLATLFLSGFFFWRNLHFHSSVILRFAFSLGCVPCLELKLFIITFGIRCIFPAIYSVNAKNTSKLSCRCTNSAQRLCSI